MFWKKKITQIILKRTIDDFKELEKQSAKSSIRTIDIIRNNAGIFSLKYDFEDNQYYHVKKSGFMKYTKIRPVIFTDSEGTEITRKFKEDMTYALLRDPKEEGHIAIRNEFEDDEYGETLDVIIVPNKSIRFKGIVWGVEKIKK